MSLVLYDTYTRSLREFEPLSPDEVGLYACGPTVYDFPHIGNMRTYVFGDLLRRALVFNGYKVRHVMNITDVGHLTSDADTGEDKMEEGARRAGKTAWEIAEFYTDVFKKDMRRLNILEPDTWCRATDHIEEQIKEIQCIEAKGFTYRTSDGIYFDTSKQPDYGFIARLDVEGLEAGARVDMAKKRSITDFALWKFSPPDEQRQMEWDSPWGVGFPGWHIECSAMSAKFLGPYFDIHLGGEDHISVHHANEIAQTEACHGTRLANFWMHGYFLQLGDAKMAKSAGGFLRVQTLIDRGYDPLVYRLFCLSASYRSKLNFKWESIEGAARQLNRLRLAVHGWGEPDAEADEAYMQRFTEVVNNDLNMPRAMSVTWDLVRSDLPDSLKKATIMRFDELLGLSLAEWTPEETAVPDHIQALAEQRRQARAEKRYADADALRDQIITAGFDIKDTPKGPEITPRAVATEAAN
ncbi:MAG: cysteine--tRNA ligase [Gemmatimonadetes bacterium]|nr:cysteine--tRNA ligase [Gemmatimonadota bacterium]